METGTAIGIGVAVVGGLFLLNMISEQNRAAIAATAQVQQGGQQGSPLGETGGAIFGALTGLGQGIASIMRASSSGGQKQPTRPTDGASPGTQGCSFNPALPITATNTPVCVGRPQA